MNNVWMAGWVLAVGGCAVTVNGTLTSATDVPAIDAGARGTDASTSMDLPASRDASAARDVPIPPDEPVPSGPFAFALAWHGAEGPDVFSRSFAVTVFDDGRLQGSTTEPMGGATLPISERFAGGADEVRQARAALEATGVGDVPEGTYRVEPYGQHNVLRYLLGGRVLVWTITDVVPPGAPPGTPPPAALVAAIRVADALVDPHIRWANDTSSDE